MTNETFKTQVARGVEFEQRYLLGRVIDIGCGSDLIVPHAEPFDLMHGDAQNIASLRPRSAYDTVYSSHCLEHMRDVPKALQQWWSLVRSGGYLVLVVPDEELYEQGGWPSLFNYDHKATFRIGGNPARTPVSYDILELVYKLESAEIVSCERQDQGYDHTLCKSGITSLERLLFRTQQVCRAVIRRLGGGSGRADRLTRRIFALLGAPVDQTEGEALAQIQIIARKKI